MISSELPTVSVVVPVHNGRETITSCLDALMASEGATPEVVVVDDASADETPELVGQYPVRLLRLKTNCGPAGARNCGANLATSQILLFVDADVEVRPDTVRRVAEKFRDHSGLSALFGSYDDNPAGRDLLSQYRNLLHHAVHQQGREEAETFWSGCGAVGKDVFLAMGGFSTSFGRPSIEDIELGARMISAGHRIRLVKDLQVKHLKRWRLWEMIRTDVCARAIPWTQLILSGYKRGGGLNLQLRYLLSAAAGVTMVALGGAAVWRRELIIAAIVFFCWFVHLNRKLLLVFHQSRGPLFALATIPLLLMYYLYSIVGFGVGMVMHIVGPRSGQPNVH